jgi:hypothetical protein
MKIYLKHIKFFSLLFFFACNNTTIKFENGSKDILNSSEHHSKNSINLAKTKHYECIKITVNTDNEFNEVSSLLAGEKSHKTQKSIYDSTFWEIYREFIDISWKKLNQQRLSKISSWRDKELSKVDALSHFVFYPFSGPDFLTCSVLFPKADTFVLLGLEPVGALPEFSKMTIQRQQEYLYSFSNSLGDIFDKSYFITKKMLKDFQSNKVNGLLPVLSFFIKKMNYEIADMKYIYKDSTQQIKEMDYYSKSKFKPFGIKITATKDSCAKTIYYFRYNVMDKFFNDSSVFYIYLNKYNHFITYIKSASYLLNNPFMSNMRQFILKNSVAILQDDTGVPYSYLKDSTQWKLQLYGEYIKPVKDFGKMGYQPDLAKKMKEDSASIPKLPFHLGYHWGTKKDVLLLAIKKTK